VKIYGVKIRGGKDDKGAAVDLRSNISENEYFKWIWKHI